MSDVDLSALLSRPAGEIKRPKLPPAGKYALRVMSYHDTGDDGQPIKSSTGNVQVYYEVQLEGLIEGDPSAMEDVAMPFGMRLYFVLTQKALGRLSEFLVRDLGLDGSVPLGSLMPQGAGRMCAANIILRPSNKDPAVFYPNIASTEPLS